MTSQPFTAESGSMLDWLRVAAEALDKARGQDAWRLQENEVAEATRLVGQLHNLNERALVEVVAEADDRGLADSYRRAGSASRAARGSGLVEWSTRHAPELPTPMRFAAIRVAEAMTAARRGNRADAPTLGAFELGALPLLRADQVLSTMAAARPLIAAQPGSDRLSAEQATAEDHGYQQVLIDAAAGTDRQFRTACSHLLSILRPGEDDEAVARAQHQSRCLTERPGPGGLTDFLVRADPTSAAYIRACIMALSAPAPDENGADPRTPGQRRFDALLTIIQRGMTARPDQTATPNVTLIVTMTAEQFAGDEQGAAVTDSEHPLPAGRARRLACLAGVVPAVLGAGSAVLDLGWTRRLASPAQRLALLLRDRHCTFAGCSIPANWCAAHHLTWWSRGGRTDLDQMALLCQRHHTLVHDRDLQGVVAADGRVSWQVRDP